MKYYVDINKLSDLQYDLKNISDKISSVNSAFAVLTNEFTEGIDMDIEGREELIESLNNALNEIDDCFVGCKRHERFIATSAEAYEDNEISVLRQNDLKAIGDFLVNSSGGQIRKVDSLDSVSMDTKSLDVLKNAYVTLPGLVFTSFNAVTNFVSRLGWNSEDAEDNSYAVLNYFDKNNLLSNLGFTPWEEFFKANGYILTGTESDRAIWDAFIAWFNVQNNTNYTFETWFKQYAGQILTGSAMVLAGFYFTSMLPGFKQFITEIVNGNNGMSDVQSVGKYNDASEEEETTEEEETEEETEEKSEEETDEETTEETEEETAEAEDEETAEAEEETEEATDESEAEADDENDYSDETESDDEYFASNEETQTESEDVSATAEDGVTTDTTVEDNAVEDITVEDSVSEVSEDSADYAASDVQNGSEAMAAAAAEAGAVGSEAISSGSGSTSSSGSASSGGYGSSGGGTASTDSFGTDSADSAGVDSTAEDTSYNAEAYDSENLFDTAATGESVQSETEFKGMDNSNISTAKQNGGNDSFYRSILSNGSGGVNFTEESNGKATAIKAAGVGVAAVGSAGGVAGVALGGAGAASAAAGAGAVGAGEIIAGTSAILGNAVLEQMVHEVGKATVYSVDWLGEITSIALK